MAIAGFLPEAFIGRAQLRDIGIGLDIFDHVDQTFTQQRLEAIHQPQVTGFGKGHDGNVLVFGDGGQVLQAAPAETGIHWVVKSGGHGGSLVFVVGSDAMLAVQALLHKSIIRRFESAGPIVGRAHGTRIQL
ncbi:hypothetical protein D3C76_887700 [compost metagenome]